MYNVSDAYIEEMLSNETTRTLRGKVDNNLAFSSSDIVKGSFVYTNKAVSKTDIMLGSAYVGELTLTFTKRFAEAHFSRGTARGKVITADVGLWVNDKYEYVPVGVFTIEEATWGKSGLSIKAYDNMLKLDKPMDFTISSGTMNSMLRYCCSSCDIELGMTREEVEALPNGDQIVGIYPVNDLETYRDCISWLAQTCCAFATIDRNGKLVLRNFGNETGVVIGANRRKLGCSFSDFETFYASIVVTNLEDDTTSTYYAGDFNGLQMNIGGNPFVQYGTNEVKTTMRTNIARKLSEFRYVPFKCEMFRDICFDLGDVIRFTDGSASISSDCCIMAISYSFEKGITLQGFGKNPAIGNARSEADKKATSSNNRSKLDTIGYVQYTNIEPFELDQSELSYDEVGKVRFALEKEGDVDIWMEFNPFTEFQGAGAENSDHRCRIQYYLDGELLDYRPSETWNIYGFHIIHLGYHIRDVSASVMHEFVVKMAFINAKVEFDINDANIVLSACGIMKQAEWDGLIEISDKFHITARGNAIIPEFAESVSASVQTPQSATLSDGFHIVARGNARISFTDELQIVSKMDVYERVTEDGEYVRITEDGGMRLTEGDIV